ncbi:MAG: 3-phosphoshikimate 1-carboxyvinyltransferase [Candidatus Cryptobacteroides sp.]
MVCTVLQNKNLDELIQAMDTCRMAEIRLDSCPLDLDDIDELFSTAEIPLVATCRLSEVAGTHPEMSEVAVALYCEQRLSRAVEAGANYVDLEIEAPKEMLKRLKKSCQENGTLLIRSFHDFKGTDSVQALKAVVEKCVYHGADIVKIATTAHTDADVQNVLSLYDDPSIFTRNPTGKKEQTPETTEGRLIAFCMGDAGRESRLDCLGKGAPFTYAALTGAEVAAPGQWLAEDMQARLEQGLKTFDADVLVPSSKSYVQRAVIAAALAGGKSVLRRYTPCEDSESSIAVARALGATVTKRQAGDDTVLEIEGIGATEGCLGRLASLNVGESGLLTRLMIPVASELAAGPVTIDGQKTLKGRKLAGLRDIMTEFGVEVESVDETVPVTVRGHLNAANAEISGENGSQLVSGLLMAMPLAQRNMSLLVENPKSIPYTFMTADVLSKFGIKISNEMLGDRDFLASDGDWSLCTEMIFKVRAGQKYRAADMDLEGDWSAAVPFLVAGAVFGKACVDGLNTASVQADLAIMDVLMAAGASITQLDGDEGEIHVNQSPLLAFDTDLSHCPDLFPVVAVLAAFCQGRSRLYGVGRLAHKESDRAAAIAEMLTKMGVEVKVDMGQDVMEIVGHSLQWRVLNRRLLRGGQFTSHHDHRMVMALEVASLGADSPVEIDDLGCVAKSFPGFVEDFEDSAICTTLSETISE